TLATDFPAFRSAFKPTIRVPLLSSPWLISSDNQTAGNAIPGVAGGITRQVIRLRMDHERRSPVAENGVVVFPQGHVRIIDRDFRLAGMLNDEVIHVTGMRSFGILQAVLLPFRIEMWACGLEVRRITFRVLMNMDGVLAGLKTLQL